MLVGAGKVKAKLVTDWLLAPTPRLMLSPVKAPVKSLGEPYEISKIVPEVLAALK